MSLHARIIEVAAIALLFSLGACAASDSIGAQQVEGTGSQAEPTHEVSERWSVVTPQHPSGSDSVETEAGTLTVSFSGSYSFLGGGPLVPHSGTLEGVVDLSWIPSTRAESACSVTVPSLAFRVDVEPALNVSFGGFSASLGSGSAVYGPFAFNDAYTNWSLSGLTVFAYSPVWIDGFVEVTWQVECGRTTTAYTKVMKVPIW